MTLTILVSFWKLALCRRLSRDYLARLISVRICTENKFTLSVFIYLYYFYDCYLAYRRWFYEELIVVYKLLHLQIITMSLVFILLLIRYF